MSATTRILPVLSLAVAAVAALAGCSGSSAPGASGSAPTESATPTSTSRSLADVPYVPRAKCGDEPRNNFVSLPAAWTRADLPDGCEGIIDGGGKWGATEQAVFDAHPGLDEETFLAAFGACAYRDFRPYLGSGAVPAELVEQAKVSLDICPTNPAAAELAAAVGA